MLFKQASKLLAQEAVKDAAVKGALIGAGIGGVHGLISDDVSVARGALAGALLGTAVGAGLAYKSPIKAKLGKVGTSEPFGEKMVNQTTEVSGAAIDPIHIKSIQAGETQWSRLTRSSDSVYFDLETTGTNVDIDVPWQIGMLRGDKQKNILISLKDRKMRKSTIDWNIDQQESILKSRGVDPDLARSMAEKNVREFFSMLEQGQMTPEIASKMGITDYEFANSLTEATDMFMRFGRGAEAYVGHNVIDFDRAMMVQIGGERIQKMMSPDRMVDTLHMARYIDAHTSGSLATPRGSYKLQNLARRYGVDEIQTHTAVDDLIMNRKVVEAMIRRMNNG